MAIQGWLERAACFNHPVLRPDAWGKFTGQAPSGEGAEAWVVCAFACPVRKECAANFQGADIVAGGGWFTKEGKFIEPETGFMDLNRAAAYLGVTVVQMRLWAKTRLATFKIGKRTHFLTNDIVTLGANPRVGPPHGTEAASRVHLIRGEGLCATCLRAKVEMLALEPAA